METLIDLLPFWKKLNPAQQKYLAASTNRRAYEKGTFIRGASDDCLGILLVLEGQLRVFTVSDEGKELTMFRLFERDFCLFSASCLLHGIQFDVMITAEEKTTALHIPPTVYKKLMEESPAVANYTNELMASRFSDVMWLMDQILNKKLDTRLAAFLIEESMLTGNTELHLTHEQIGNHLGSAREVVTRILKYFQNEGLVTLSRGKIVLTDKDNLEKLASVSLH